MFLKLFLFDFWAIPNGAQGSLLALCRGPYTVSGIKPELR